VLADAGYDSNKVAEAVEGQDRRQRLNKDYGGYGQRWQAETVFSMIKRRLSSGVAGRTYVSQRRELWLLAITQNVMILYVCRGFLLSTCDPDSPWPAPR
jgi:hypothetical protein